MSVKYADAYWNAEISHHAIFKIAVSYRAIWKMATSFNLQDKNFLSSNLLDRKLQSCKLQNSSFLSWNLQKSGLLSCNFQDSSLLSCNLQDSNSLSCNLHDSNFLIGSLVHKYEYEVRLNFSISHLWWYESLACGHLVGSKRVEKHPVHVPPGYVWGKGLAWLSACGAYWTFLMAGQRDRMPSFHIFLVCTTLIVGGGWWVVAWSKNSFLGPAVIVPFSIPGFVQAWMMQGGSKI